MKGFIIAIICSLLAVKNILTIEFYALSIFLCLTYSFCEILQGMFGEDLEKDIWFSKDEVNEK